MGIPKIMCFFSTRVYQSHQDHYITLNCKLENSLWNTSHSLSTNVSKIYLSSHLKGRHISQCAIGALKCLLFSVTMMGGGGGGGETSGAMLEMRQH